MMKNRKIGQIIWIGPRRDITLEGAGRIADMIINGHDERTIEEIAETEHLYHIIPGHETKWTNICQIIEENDGWTKQINEWLPQLIEFIKQNDKMVTDYRNGNHKILYALHGRFKKMNKSYINIHSYQITSILDAILNKKYTNQ